MDPEERIRKVSNWADHIVSLYLGADDPQGSDLVAEIVRIYGADTRRRDINMRQGSLLDLANLKCAIRLTGVLLDDIQRQEPAAMEGWRYLRPAANLVQQTYGLLYGIALDLGRSIVEVEEGFPELDEYFDQERREYQHKCEQMVDQYRAAISN